MALKIIATGGTFDKHYDALAGTLTFAESHLSEVLKRSRLTLPVTVDICMMVDSRDMQDSHRQTILAACVSAAETAIVIIHGTDTMRDTAAELGAAQLAKTIILTGAMIPYEVAQSDALFNFGCAVGVAQLLPHGVYVAMNGQVFTWDNVQKNRALGVFSTQ